MLDWSREVREEREPDVDPPWVEMETGKSTSDDEFAEKAGVTMMAAIRIRVKEKTASRYVRIGYS